MIISTIKKFANNKTFIVMALSLAIPVAIQNLLNTSINLIDSFMVSSLTAASVSAVGMSNKFFYAFNCILFGLVSGGCIFTSQFYGAKDYVGIKKVFSITLIISFLVGLIFFIITFCNPIFVIKIFTNREEIINEGWKYLKIVCLSYLLAPLIMTSLLILRSMGKVKIAVIVSICSILVNIILNYLLINGNLGFPRLEVRGAAIATVFARIVEVIIYYIYLFKTDKELFSNIKEIFSFDISYFKKMLPFTIPVVINECLWGTGSALYFVAYGRLSTESSAALTIVSVIQDMIFTFFIGVGSASTTIIGNTLGAGEFKKAKEYAHNMIIIALAMSIFVGVFLFLMTPLVVSLYSNLGINVQNLIRNMLLITLIYVPFRSIDFLMICGIFRPGGDTTVSIFLDCGSMWLVGIPIAFLGVYVFKLNTILLFFMVNIECALKTIGSMIRFFQYKWIKNVIY
ncbi:MAG: MATE family efflux transporter [Eubacteriales bacterium]|nr:MATE family efflux transporter [Eubacteriales bacterium]